MRDYTEGNAITAAGRAAADVLAHRIAQIGTEGRIGPEVHGRLAILAGAMTSLAEVGRAVLLGGPTDELRGELVYLGTVVLRAIEELDDAERWVPTVPAAGPAR